MVRAPGRTGHPSKSHWKWRCNQPGWTPPYLRIVRLLPASSGKVSISRRHFCRAPRARRPAVPVGTPIRRDPFRGINPAPARRLSWQRSYRPVRAWGASAFLRNAKTSRLFIVPHLRTQNRFALLLEMLWRLPGRSEPCNPATSRHPPELFSCLAARVRASRVLPRPASGPRDRRDRLWRCPCRHRRRSDKVRRLWTLR